MKRNLLYSAALLALLVPAIATAGDEAKDTDRGARKAKFLEKFDTNGDGTIDDAEREAAKAAVKAERAARKAQALEKFDTNGDGKLDETERAALRESGDFKRGRHGQRGQRGRRAHMRRDRVMRALVVDRFDADGDGKLNDTEKEALKAAIQKKREQMKAKILEKFDANGDGKLDDAERAEAKKAHAGKRGERRGRRDK